MVLVWDRATKKIANQLIPLETSHKSNSMMTNDHRAFSLNQPVVNQPAVDQKGFGTFWQQFWHQPMEATSSQHFFGHHKRCFPHSWVWPSKQLKSLQPQPGHQRSWLTQQHRSHIKPVVIMNSNVTTTVTNSMTGTKWSRSWWVPWCSDLLPTINKNHKGHGEALLRGTWWFILSGFSNSFNEGMERYKISQGLAKDEYSLQVDVDKQERMMMVTCKVGPQL